jgi:hypothetical protein
LADVHGAAGRTRAIATAIRTGLTNHDDAVSIDARILAAERRVAPGPCGNSFAHGVAKPPNEQFDGSIWQGVEIEGRDVSANTGTERSKSRTASRYRRRKSRWAAPATCVTLPSRVRVNEKVSSDALVYS